jgi:hypothetical protein
MPITKIEKLETEFSLDHYDLARKINQLIDNQEEIIGLLIKKNISQFDIVTKLSAELKKDWEDKIDNACMEIISEEPPTRWKPKKNEGYWFILSNGDIGKDIWWKIEPDETKHNFGNCFRTEKEAQTARNKIKELLKVGKDK